ncbi:hypothetical protein AB4140_03880 [Shewanella sp. 10N.286.51.B2]|uniref:hypothetical protein n=1 Tax=Shewanella sp. 10N.286.51.B2 TaxID=3229707 RepID=UPI00354C6BC4
MGMQFLNTQVSGTQVTQVGNVSLYFIGDIYGRLDKLTDLLAEIDFDIDDPQSSIQFVKLVFCGNLIASHQPAQTDAAAIEHIALLNFIKRLVDEGYAYCLLGINEFNAIGWSKHHPITDEPLVSASKLALNSDSLSQQGPFFLSLFDPADESIYQWIDWFMSLPLFLDFGHIRAVHACWDQQTITALAPYIEPSHALSQQYWPCAFDKDHSLNHALNIILNYPTFELTEQHPHYLLTVPVIVAHYPLDSFPDIQNEYLACVNYNTAVANYPLVSFAWHQGRKKQLEDACVSDNAQLSLGEFCFIDQPTPEEQIASGVEALLAMMIKQLPKVDISPEALCQFQQQVDLCLWQDWDPSEQFPNARYRNQYQTFIEPIAQLALAMDSEQLCAYLAILARYQLEIENDNLENRCLKVAFKLTRLAAHALKH